METGVGLGGQGAVALEPTSVIATMAAVTERLGLGATVSTTYYPPYHVARVFATLDNLSDGRISWNVVTSLNDSEARNFGVDEHLEHDIRYDRADEFLEAVKKLWSSWSRMPCCWTRLAVGSPTPRRFNTSIIVATGCPSVALQVPRSRQGEPVILQAGLSPRGRRFAGRWAEAVFSVSPNLDIMRAVYQDIKAHVAAAGRDPEQTKVFTAVMPVLGETEQVARERLEYLNSLVHPEVGLSTLSSHSGLDLSKYPLDTKFSDIVADLGDRHVPTMLQMFSAVAGGGADLTLAELGRRYGTNVGFVPQWAGTAEQIADQLVSHFEAGAADGFIISAAYLPGIYEEFVDQVVPLLQQRGVFRTEYEGATLREHLGLARPEVGSI